MAAMHASSCLQLYPAYSPILTHFPAPKGLVSKEAGVRTGSYLHDSSQG